MNIGELSVLTIIDSGRITSFPKIPCSLIHILPNFHEMYRNDCRLPAKSKLWYSNPFQNASMPNERKLSNFGGVVTQFSFSIQACQVNDDRQIAAELRHIFNFCSLKLWSYCTDLHQSFTRCRGISVAINPCIYKMMLHLVWKCQSKKWRRSILMSAKRPQS